MMELAMIYRVFYCDLDELDELIFFNLYKNGWRVLKIKQLKDSFRVIALQGVPYDVPR